MSAAKSTTEYFTGLAQAYDANRPSYPPQAIDAVLDGLPAHPLVIDIGCGTGISSRLLAHWGARVIGIDPNADMLEQARAVTAGIARRESPLEIDFRQATGERTGLPDAIADCVVCAQAFHWLKPLEALREFHRVLRPPPALSRVALVWNVRDDAHDEFTLAYSNLARRAQADAAARGLDVHDLRSGDPTVGGCFTHARLQVFPNPQPLSLEGLLGRARSASYFPPAGRLRDEMEEALRQLFTANQRDGDVILWHRTEVTTARRAAS